MNPVSGFILAGGASTRMGRDKALLDWHGRNLLNHMADLLSSVTNTVQVVGREPLPDLFPGRGPLSGILTALQISESEANLLVAVDLPLLTREFLRYMRSRIENSNRRLVACKAGSHFPLCIGARRTLIPELERRVTAGELSVHAFIESCGPEIIPEFEMRHAGFDPSIFRNINTEEDYLAALRKP